MSAEMALGLRNSLTTISGYAQQLAASRDAGTGAPAGGRYCRRGSAPGSHDWWFPGQRKSGEGWFKV